MFQPNISNPPDKARQDPDTKYLFICTMRTLNLKSTLLSPGSLYQSHGRAPPRDRHVRHQGPDVCTWIVHLHSGEGGVTIVTPDCIETSLESETRGPCGSSRRHDEVIQHRLDLGHQVGDTLSCVHPNYSVAVCSVSPTSVARSSDSIILVPQ